MKRIFALAASLLFLSSAVFAQETETETTEININNTNLNETGDQYVRLGLMVTKPLNFDDQLYTGGAGTLGYHQFITPYIALGGDVSFGYNPTLGGNIFTYIPILFSTTVQPVYKQFEFPVTLSLGVCTETYLNKSYFPAFVVKPAAGVFYRMSPSWSFGVEAECLFIPEYHSDSDDNDYGLFGSVVLSARYHF